MTLDFNLLSYIKNVARWSSSVLNLRYFRVRKIAANQNERRCDVVEVEIAQVRHILTASEYTERPLKVNSRKQHQRYLRALHNISESEA